MTSSLLLFLAASGLGYLLGSTPFGLILTRVAGLGDVRAIGSGNIGATNVLRTGNKKIAAATLALDLLKATVAVLLGIAIASHFFAAAPATAYHAGIAAGFAAFIGHLFPFWLQFKGGKGVATYIGMLLGAAPLIAALFCIVWLITAFAFRYSSLAALVAAASSPVLALLFGASNALIVVLCLMSAMLFWKHRDNIARLRSNEETKIGQPG